MVRRSQEGSLAGAEGIDESRTSWQVWWASGEFRAGPPPVPIRWDHFLEGISEPVVRWAGAGGVAVAQKRVGQGPVVWIRGKSKEDRDAPRNNSQAVLVS